MDAWAHLPANEHMGGTLTSVFEHVFGLGRLARATSVFPCVAVDGQRARYLPDGSAPEVNLAWSSFRLLRLRTPEAERWSISINPILCASILCPALRKDAPRMD